MNDSVLIMKNVNKYFGKYKALSNVNLEINHGDIYGLIGENGAGKTTIMRLITQLSPLKDGVIQLLGEYNQKYTQALKHVGSLIESPAFFDKLTVYENLKIIATERGISDRNTISEVINQVGLVDKVKTKAKNLSLGQKQRLGLAIAILPHPDFLILDEPINGLDPTGIIQFRKILSDLNREQQITILISSHILTELYQISNKFGFMYKGHLIKQITKEELDKENESGLIITVDDIEKASQVIDSSLDLKFSVLDDSNLIVDARSYDTSVINEILVEKGVQVKGMVNKQGSLEDYYTNLIAKMEVHDD